MRSAIIGHTGFVGSELARQTRFDDFFNSKNIGTISGKSYDLLVCSAAPAEKWKANKEPEKDLENINRICESLAKVKAGKVILISTIDVYPSPVNVDEETLFDENSATAYGKNRRLLEKFVQDRFNSLVVRLPGLFGEGLKKNVIYDFLNNNQVDKIHADSVFQFYPLANAWRDIRIALDQKLKIVNFATEPTRVSEIAREGFGFDFSNRPDGRPAFYDFRTKFGSYFGGSGGYIYSRPQVLAALKDFVNGQVKRKK